MKNILIVDDEIDLTNMLKDFFELQGFVVYCANNGEEALNKINEKLDLILLDINMPDIDGTDICKKVRNFILCPIIFLTAKIEEKDRINGLMAGGDDYILKPFSLEELRARVEAHLRREERKKSKDKVNFFGDFTIDFSNKEFFYKDNKITLTKTEFDIVEILMENRGMVFSKEKIYERLWGFDKDGDSSIITEHVRRIRGKINKYTDRSTIETVWGIGYRWIG